MIKSTSYYLRYKSNGSLFDSCEDVKTLKQLEKVIKKFIDRGVTFEVWVKFNFAEVRYGFSDYTSFEIWMYNAETDEVFTYNLRKNKYYKTLRWYEKRLRPLMLKYNRKIV